MGLTSCPRYFVRVPSGQTGNKSGYRECQITCEMTCNNYRTEMTNAIAYLEYILIFNVQYNVHNIRYGGHMDAYV